MKMMHIKKITCCKIRNINETKQTKKKEMETKI